MVSEEKFEPKCYQCDQPLRPRKFRRIDAYLFCNECFNDAAEMKLLTNTDESITVYVGGQVRGRYNNLRMATEHIALLMQHVDRLHKVIDVMKNEREWGEDE